jgi:hypothetical protein
MRLHSELCSPDTVCCVFPSTSVPGYEITLRGSENSMAGKVSCTPFLHHRVVRLLDFGAHVIVTCYCNIYDIQYDELFY